MMIRGRGSWVGFSTRLKLYGIRRLCNKGENGGNKLDKTTESSAAQTETSVSRYDETYKKLDKLDFVTAAKILFTEPPKTNKFGFDWHVVQFIIVCLPSVAVYLVAQYARRKMKIMDAELGEKNRKEEEKKEKEEAEQKALQKEAATKSQDELMEMKARLGKIEETIKDIVLEAKKPSGTAPTKTQEDHSSKLFPKQESKPEKEHKGHVQKPGDGPH
ncbi:hypothetical protein CARUB_v10020936mg [Capsella rubella]|uniref:Uncharacterized protein n=1 Tax=Capsella rubella TaxID=81985 RepID=R0I0J7_9BRAS|nr:uncharacterized protein LOC17895356 [Capsella rubella]EOA35709.1 hypothetical protein CARUB_v10020936mg [Capsella rubella]